MVAAPSKMSTNDSESTKEVRAKQASLEHFSNTVKIVLQSSKARQHQPSGIISASEDYKDKMKLF